MELYRATMAQHSIIGTVNFNYMYLYLYADQNLDEIRRVVRQRLYHTRIHTLAAVSRVTIILSKINLQDETYCLLDMIASIMFSVDCDVIRNCHGRNQQPDIAGV